MINNLARIDKNFWGTDFNRDAKILTETVRDLFGHSKVSNTVSNLDLYEKDEEYIAFFEVPGVKKEDLDITIEKNYVDILGQIDHQEIEGAKYISRGRKERKSYACRINLSENVDRDKISASLEHGILKLTMPKAEALKPKKITIT